MSLRLSWALLALTLLVSSPLALAKSSKRASRALGTTNFMLSYENFQKLSRPDQIKYTRGIAKSFTWLSIAYNKAHLRKSRSSRLFIDSLQSLLAEEAFALSELSCVGGGVPIQTSGPSCGTNEYAGFKCEGEGEEICNPVLFGVRTNGKPLCHRDEEFFRGNREENLSATTKWCWDNSTIGETTKLNLVLKRNNKAEWARLRLELNYACTHPEMANDESAASVLRACSWAQKQMDWNETRQSATMSLLKEKGYSYSVSEAQKAVKENSSVIRISTKGPAVAVPSQQQEPASGLPLPPQAGADAIQESDQQVPPVRSKHPKLRPVPVPQETPSMPAEPEGPLALSNPSPTKPPQDLGIRDISQQQSEESEKAIYNWGYRYHKTPSTEAERLIGAAGQTSAPLKFSKVNMHKVTASQLNYRSGPGTEHSSIGQFSEGDQIIDTGNTETDENGDIWKEVKVNGDPAWVHADFVEDLGEQDWNKSEPVDWGPRTNWEDRDTMASTCQDCEVEYLDENLRLMASIDHHYPLRSEWPIAEKPNGKKTCAYNSDLGWRRLKGRRDWHEGIDIRTGGRAIDVKMPMDGLVIKTGWNGGYGRSVLVLHVPKSRHDDIINALKKARIWPNNANSRIRRREFDIESKVTNFLNKPENQYLVNVDNGKETKPLTNLVCRYSHFSGYDKSGLADASVSGNEVFAKVGTTGRSTGYHLDMRCTAKECTNRQPGVGGPGYCDPVDILPKPPAKYKRRYRC